ncbi:hypothetical protein EHR01_12345 [Leptospira mtsangambouensis]|uniref:DUF4263 domain-containing protein n=1 Tax=Leptospira mtsangambouensis TaxID=2484912 RepID=A0ABY2NYQ9_9LEPT|nr:hypothetical protein [Leptospira mtsangambouensis]TGM74285.1 hypothetical protein EHR01_12345 [Leptospira mtsangambouensis]
MRNIGKIISIIKNMHNDQNIKNLVKAFFNTKEFEVEEIPESNEKTPDLVIIKKEEKTILEIKTKIDDKEYLENIKSEIEASRIFIESNQINRKNKYTNIISKGVEQIKELDQKGSFNVLWLECAGREPEYQAALFKCSLLGIRTAIKLPASESRECYFCDHSAFFKYKDFLDGTIIHWNDRALLYLNPFSNKYDAFNKSELRKSFSRGAIDPIDLESKSIIYLADCDIDRNNQSEVGIYLAKKYESEHMALLDLTHISASTFISD